jgi:hypothetical protein
LHVYIIQGDAHYIRHDAVSMHDRLVALVLCVRFLTFAFALLQSSCCIIRNCISQCILRPYVVLPSCSLTAQLPVALKRPTKSALQCVHSWSELSLAFILKSIAII